MTLPDFLANTTSGWISVAMAEKTHLIAAFWHVFCASWKWLAFHAFAAFVYLIGKAK
jgi:hypothetical protein